MKSAVITGVSTGIGAGIVSTLMRAGWQVFGSVRSEGDGAKARDRFGNGFEPLMLDVADETSVIAAAAVVKERLGGRVLDGLVNNAGIALSDPLLVQSTADFRRQIEVNLIGPFVVTKAFAPLLGAREGAPPGRGRIVNISSIGGKLSPPFLGAYAAAKHGLEGMSGSLRRELQIFGVDVVLVGPGSVATPIWDKAEGGSDDHLAGTIWNAPFRKFTEYMVTEGRKGYSPDRIGGVVLEALTSAKPKARYAPVAGKLMNWTLPTKLPARVVDRLIGKQVGLLQPRSERT